MSQISKRVRDAVQWFLANPTTGFNQAIAATASDGSFNAFQINFGAKSKNFFLGQIDPLEIESTTPAQFPVMCLYVVGSANTNKQKFCLFSGEVTIGIDVMVSWKSSAGNIDFDTIPSAIEDAIYSVLNTADFGSWNIPSSYNGIISIARGPIDKGAEHWIQTLSARLTVEVHTT